MPVAKAQRSKAEARVLERVRAIVAGLPETTEKTAWGAPTFRVREKMFAMYVDNHHGDERVAIWCKAPSGTQGFLVDLDPDRFFAPPYVGPKGWLGIRLDRSPSWEEVAEHLREAWRLTAPKRLVAAFDGGSPRVDTGALLPAARGRRRS